jgi:hypothetical protein
MLTKPATQEDEFEITFRCGMKRDVSDDELRKRCDTHNQFVANKTQGMILQQTIAVREERTPAYCVGGGFTMLTDGSDEPPPSLDVIDPLKEPTVNNKEGESIAEDGDPSNAKEKETDAVMDEGKEKATEHDTLTEAGKDNESGKPNAVRDDGSLADPHGSAKEKALGTSNAILDSTANLDSVAQRSPQPFQPQTPPFPPAPDVALTEDSITNIGEEHGHHTDEEKVEGERMETVSPRKAVPLTIICSMP